MKQIIAGVLLVMVAAGVAEAALSTAEERRLTEAAGVLRDLRNAGDKGIPEELWNRADCVVIIPSLKRAGFLFGGEYGRGVLSCRSGNDWSAPLFVQLAKGSVGFQIGAEEVDLLLVATNRKGVERLLRNKITLGGDASVAAGPIGRSATAGTDGQMTAEMLAYSRSRGVFAGIDISGGVLRPDKDSNTDAYGDVAPGKITFERSVSAPDAARPLLRALEEQVRATTGRK